MCHCTELLVRQQWTLPGQTANHLMLCSGLYAWEGLEDHGGCWVDGLMSLLVAVLASTPVFEKSCELALSLSLCPRVS